MSSSSSFYHTTNPTPADQPSLYEQLATANANLAAVLAEYSTYTDVWNSTINIDWSLAMTHRVTLQGSPTTFTFSNARDGQKLVLELKQDSSGSRLINLPANVRYSQSIGSFLLSTTANKIDKLGFIYNESDDKYDLVAVLYGSS